MEAEQGLLGALLVDNRAMERIGDFLRHHHFHIPAHGRIYQAVEKLIERGQQASPVTLKSYFEVDEGLTHIGGAAYLAELAANVITVINTLDYAKAIYDLHLRRELIALGEEIVNEAYAHNLESDAVTALETAEARLYTLAETGQSRGGFTPLKESVLTAIKYAEKAYQSEGHVTGVTTGPARDRREARRAASVRLADPGGAAIHGQDCARHQHGLCRRGEICGGQAGRGAGRILLARNVGGPTGDTDPGRPGEYFRGFDSQGADHAGRFPPLRRG